MILLPVISLCVWFEWGVCKSERESMCLSESVSVRKSVYLFGVCRTSAFFHISLSQRILASPYIFLCGVCPHAATSNELDPYPPEVHASSNCLWYALSCRTRRWWKTHDSKTSFELQYQQALSPLTRCVLLFRACSSSVIKHKYALLSCLMFCFFAAESHSELNLSNSSTPPCLHLGLISRRYTRNENLGTLTMPALHALLAALLEPSLSCFNDWAGLCRLASFGSTEELNEFTYLQIIPIRHLIFDVLLCCKIKQFVFATNFFLLIKSRATRTDSASPIRRGNTSTFAGYRLRLTGLAARFFS